MNRQTYLFETHGFYDSSAELENEPENFFRMILRRIVSAINGSRVVIFLEEPGTGQFYVRNHVGISHDFAKSYRKMSNWTLGKVLWEETATIFDGDSPGCKEYEHLRLENDFLSLICAPIFCDGYAVGYIHCEHPHIRFTEQNLRLVSRMAQILSGNDHLWRHLVEQYEMV